MVGLNNYNGLMPESAAFTLLFMFPDRQTAYKVLTGELGASKLTKFGEIIRKVLLPRE
ncbi:hypothetical protein OK016_26290 [Vibrio chagasii]|nr:hypothetical protein [Vibrio chagasii]